MTELPPIKGGGEPWVWPGSVVPVRVDTSRRCSTCQRSVPRIAWRSDQPGDHLIIVHEHGGMRFESSASVDGNTIRFRATEDVRLMLCRDLTTVAATGRGWEASDAVLDRHPVARAMAEGDFASDLESPRFDVPPRPWAGARAFWRFVAERLFAS